MSESSPVGLYIHIPFCVSKCPYCDFYSVPLSGGAAESFAEAIADELKTKRRLTDYVKEPLTADTVYFGGGTPSLLPIKSFRRIMEAIQENIVLTENPEITVECNPSSASLELFDAYASLGINRVSLGLQSALTAERKTLGRRGTAQDVFKAAGWLKAAGITNFSLDCMLGIPKQTDASLSETLAFCFDSGCTHVSAYILKIEENTPFYRLKDKLSLPDEDEVCDLYALCCDTLERYGYLQYEISNFAKKGFMSRHNLKYWQLKPYIGLGPSAHSFYNGKRFFFPRGDVLFLGGAAPLYDGEGGGFFEYVMLALRLKTGMSLSEISRRYGALPAENIKKKALPLLEKRLIVFDGDRFCLTREGFLLSNSVIAALL